MDSQPQLGDLTAYRDLASRFVKKEIEPSALEVDRYPFADFNENAVRVASSIGLLGLCLPEEYGGSGLGMRELAAVLEIIASADASVAALLLSQALARAVLIELGPDQTARKWVTTGEVEEIPLIGSPMYSDPEELPKTVRATAANGGFRLSGQLHYLACLPVARALIIPAVIDGGRMALFLVEADSEGLKASEPVVSLGLRGMPAGDVELRDVNVPAEYRLGGDDAAAAYAGVADRFRGPLTAIALGILSGSYCYALDYAQERYQGKREIINHHMVRNMLSGMASWLDVGSVAVAHACNLADRGMAGSSELVSIQELVVTAVTRGVTDGVQILGGYGYMHEYGQEKRMRDAKQLQAMFGCSPARVLRIIEKKLAN